MFRPTSNGGEEGHFKHSYSPHSHTPRDTVAEFASPYYRHLTYMKNRSILAPLWLLLAISALITAIVVGYALTSLQQVGDRFTSFIDTDQARFIAVQEMYAQGLQSGQALRNIVLDPANTQGFKNLENAQKKFDEALASARKVATGDAAMEKAAAEISQRWQALLTTRSAISELARKDTSAAIAALNHDETPSWRAVRTLLLDEIERQGKNVAATRSGVMATVASSLRISVALIIGAALLCLILAVILARAIRRPLAQLESSMQQLASGQGDLTRRIPVKANDEVGRIAGSLNSFVTDLDSTIKRIDEIAGQLNRSSTLLSSEIAQVSDSTRAQSDAASSIASEVEQLTTSIATVADSASEVRRLSDRSLSASEESRQQLDRQIEQLERLESAVNEIAASVTDYIGSTQTITRLTGEVRDIANQTNLLALNAAIEAARAGELGRGFAVVADEVRKLAEKSASSANEINAVTVNINSKSTTLEGVVQEGINALAASRESLNAVTSRLLEGREMVSTAHQGIDEITDSVVEQKSASQDIAVNVEKIARLADDNDTSAQSAARSVRHFETLSGELRQTIQHFKTT